MMRYMAARAKLTPELAAALCVLLGGGASRGQAAAMAGVDRGTLSRWLSRGSSDRQAGRASLYASLATTTEARELLEPVGPMSEGEALALLEAAARRGNVRAAEVVLRFRRSERSPSNAWPPVVEHPSAAEDREREAVWDEIDRLREERNPARYQQ